MSYIGNTNTTQGFTPAVDFFSGNASTTAFTLSRPVASVAQVQVVVNNVAQKPSDAFTVSGNTITFTSAPSSGTNNIYVYYTSPITQVIAPGQGTVGPVQLDYATLNGTGAISLPGGTTAQRPGSPTVGMLRYNTTESKYEVYTPTGWAFLQSTIYNYNIDYLVVAGGGGGGKGINSGGGGGAGGFRAGSSFSISGGTTYTITVGSGGAGATGTGANGVNGSNSVFSSIASTGGGGGGSGALAGSSGGSGGGGGTQANSTVYAGGSGNTPSTSPSQGNNGGSGQHVPGSYEGGGGGGGAGAVGNNSAGAVAGSGGAGTASSITGSSVTYAGGGGGGGNTSGSGGTGGGGAGGSTPVAGTTNTGGGGGGSLSGANAAAGGSGIVILSIPTVNYSGLVTGSPTITTSGSNTILTFTGSGSYKA